MHKPVRPSMRPLKDRPVSQPRRLIGNPPARQIRPKTRCQGEVGIVLPFSPSLFPFLNTECSGASSGASSEYSKAPYDARPCRGCYAREPLYPCGSDACHALPCMFPSDNA